MKKELPITHTINMHVSNDDNFLSPYSMGEEPVISQEVAEFLENTVRAMPSKEGFSLNIKGDCIDENEKQKYSLAIKNYYTLKFKDAERESRKKTIVSMAFTLIGVIALAIMIILSNHDNIGEVWTECIDIFAWVFLWEAVDLFFMERGTIAVKRRIYKKFMQSTITFES